MNLDGTTLTTLLKRMVQAGVKATGETQYAPTASDTAETLFPKLKALLAVAPAEGVPAHTHFISQVTGLSDALASKATLTQVMQSMAAHLAAFEHANIPSDSEADFLSVLTSLPSTPFGLALLTLADSDELTALINDASDTEAGKIEIATQAEVDDGLETTKAVVASHTQPANKITVDRVPGSTYSTLQHFINTMHSPGLISGGMLSVTSASEVTVTAGTGMLRIADDDVSSLRFVDWSSDVFVVPNDDTPRFFGVVYNAGSPVVEMRTDEDWDKDTEVALGSALRNTAGTLFVAVNRPFRTGDPITNIIQRFDAVAPVQRDAYVGGLIIGTTGVRNMTLTSGRIWQRLIDFDQAAIDTSGSDSIVTGYYNGTSWVFTPGVTQWPNTQYNDITSGLATVSPARYANLWFYVGSSGGGLRMLYGQAQHVLLADALEESEPTFVPPNIRPYLLLVGKLTFQNGGATPTQLVSPFTGAGLGGSAGGSINVHNDLSGLQGGAAGEYYHLTSAQHTAVLAAAASEGTTTSTGTQDNFAHGNVRVLRCNNASLLTLRGLAAGVAGQRITIISVGAGQVDLAHQNVNSSEANRLINFATSAATSLAAGVGVAEYEYDATTARWRLIEHEQGAAITPAFSAGDYTANGAMTWTVASGDVTTMSYYLRGRTLVVAFELNNTTIGGTPNSTLIRPIPGGYMSAKQSQQTNILSDNGIAGFGKCFVTAGGTTLNWRDGAGADNWTGGTDNCGVNGVLNLEVS